MRYEYSVSATGFDVGQILRKKHFLGVFGHGQVNSGDGCYLRVGNLCRKG